MSEQSTTCPICNGTTRFNFSARDLMFNHYERYDYNQCTDCDLIFQTPLPSTERISGFYPNDYEVYEEQSRLKKISPLKWSLLKNKFGYSHLESSWVIDFISTLTHAFKKDSFEIPFTPNGMLLDIGCGNGRFLHGMQQLGWKTKGVEFNAGAVAVCNKSNLDVFHGDLFSANLEDNSFDVVNLSHVIEHVQDPKALFHEVARILKPNGLFVVKTPNSSALGRAWFDTNWYANDVPRHLYLFSQKNLLAMSDSCGLEVVESSTSSSPKIILNSVDYVLKNNGKPSKRIWWRRLLAKPYVYLAKYKKRGDEIHIVFKKR